MKKETQEEADKRVADNIAQNISRLAAAATELSKGKFKRKTLLVLLAHSTGLSQGSVNCVLDALESLEDDYLK